MADEPVLSLFAAWAHLMRAIAGRGNGSHLTQFQFNKVRIRHLDRLMRGK